MAHFGGQGRGNGPTPGGGGHRPPPPPRRGYNSPPPRRESWHEPPRRRGYGDWHEPPPPRNQGGCSTVLAAIILLAIVGFVVYMEMTGGKLPWV